VDIRKLSVRERVLLLTSAAILSLIALTAAFSITGQMTKRLQSVQVQLSAQADESRRLETELLRLEMYASRFLAERNVDDLANFENDAPRLRELVSTVEQYTSDWSLSSLSERYIAKTRAAFEARERLGLDENSGLEGELRKAVHDIERRLQTLDQESLTVHMLMMRRHEKDFMMRLDTSYIARFEARADEFSAGLQQADLSEIQRDEISALFSAYQRGFEDWSEGRLQLMRQQDMAVAAHAELASAVSAMSGDLLARADTATIQQRTVIDGTIVAIWIAVVILITICGALAVWIGRSIVSQIAGVSDEMLSLCRAYDTNASRPLRRNARSELERMRRVLDFFAENIAETERLNMEVRFHRDHLADEVAKQTAALEHQKLQLELSLDQERELRQLQNQFVATVSHEFRTPLTIIDGTARRISRSLSKMDAGQISERLATIRSSVRRLSDMVDETLDSSRVSEGEIDCNYACVDIRQFVEGIVERHRDIASEFTFEYDVGMLPDCVDADPKHLDHIVSNLVSNAIKYSRLRPHIKVTMGRDGDCVFLSVKDRGVGIPKEELPKITSRFFRASTSAGIKGTGIGLNLVAQLIRAHNGKFNIDSKEGEWTEVTVRLPISAPEDAQKQDADCCSLISAA
tara:strand:- start:18774 stop:20678 length:1905 start_codon:yes stop_codon:yes gene_type:complete